LRKFFRKLNSRRPEMNLQKRENIFFLAFLIVALWSIPQVAFAGPAWEDALQTIVGYVTGSTARYIAILGVVGFGFAAFLGRISWKRALEIVVAIAVVFGAAKIVDMFAGTGTP
jgi:type IV secretion system protein VirB2